MPLPIKSFTILLSIVGRGGGERDIKPPPYFAVPKYMGLWACMVKNDVMC